MCEGRYVGERGSLDGLGSRVLFSSQLTTFLHHTVYSPLVGLQLSLKGLVLLNFDLQISRVLQKCIHVHLNIHVYVTYLYHYLVNVKTPQKVLHMCVLTCVYKCGCTVASSLVGLISRHFDLLLCPAGGFLCISEELLEGARELEL